MRSRLLGSQRVVLFDSILLRTAYLVSTLSGCSFPNAGKYTSKDWRLSSKWIWIHDLNAQCPSNSHSLERKKQKHTNIQYVCVRAEQKAEGEALAMEFYIRNL